MSTFTFEPLRISERASREGPSSGRGSITRVGPGQPIGETARPHCVASIIICFTWPHRERSRSPSRAKHITQPKQTIDNHITRAVEQKTSTLMKVKNHHDMQRVVGVLPLHLGRFQWLPEVVQLRDAELLVIPANRPPGTVNSSSGEENSPAGA
eukprot:5235995-Pyramimonas_sp.AAC.1